MTSLIVEFTRNGVKNPVRGGVDSVADGVELADLIKASALPLRLLDTAVQEYFNSNAATRDAGMVDEPEVLIPTNRDGDLDVPRHIKIQVGVLPRDPFDAPPSWFVEGCKELFPREDWTETPSPREVIGEKDGKKIFSIPEGEEYCSLVEQQAVSLFDSHLSSVLDNWGWVDETMVVEPYGMNMENIKKLTSVCEQLGWRFEVLGKSAYHPSGTLRIEIHPK
jgi:hypothetical protein